MRKVNLTPARQQRFIKALSKTGSVTKAAALAGTSRTRVYELRNRDPAFAAAWEDAEEVAADRLEDEARRRAVEGVTEPLVSAVNWFVTMTASQSWSVATRITFSWR